MNTSSPTTPGLQCPYSILLRGSPGAHKTTLALQFPNVGILDCDENLRGPEAYIHTVLKKPLEYRYTRIRYDDNGKPIENPEEWWKRYVKSFNEMVLDPWVKTIVTDSLTGLNHMLLLYTLKIQGVVAIEKMERQHWLPFIKSMQELAFRMRQTGKTNLVTTHETSTTNKQGEVIKYDISLSTKLRENFGWIFTDVWYIEAQPDLAGQKRPSKLFCTPAGLRKDLKSTNPLIPQELEATWENVNKYLNL